jgi:sulfite reductase alpha subunit-like flavoprotein
MPRNGKQLLKQMTARTEPFSERTRFLVFGLGDSSYYFFCKAAKEVEAVMERLGANKLLPMGTGDDSAEGGMDNGLYSWLDLVWPALEVPPPAEVPHITPVKVIFSEKAIIRPETDQLAVEQFFRSEAVNAVSATVLSNRLMCREDYNRDFRTIHIEQTPALRYQLGDALDIYPQNDEEAVANFLNQYSCDFGEHTVVKLHSYGIDGDISLHSLFTYVLDLFGKPTKHFLHQLATFETSAEERATMLHYDFLPTAAKKNGMTIADALLRFKDAAPPLPALLAMIPVIKPRAYSIVSAPLASPSKIELLVLIETWWCEEGMRYGLNCRMLRKKQSGDRIWCRIKPSSMEAPSTAQAVLCASIGSGLAPMMAFLRDRVRDAENGVSVAPFSMFFGNRFTKEEFLYQEELQACERKYDWFTLHTAFSRDDPNKKVYVQDIVGSTDDARRLLLEQPDGMLFVCGNRNLPKPLQDALVKSFSNGSNDEKLVEFASKAMEDLYIHGRAQQEVW